jgi:hypothetical protein
MCSVDGESIVRNHASLKGQSREKMSDVHVVKKKYIAAQWIFGSQKVSYSFVLRLVTVLGKIKTPERGKIPQIG